MINFENAGIVHRNQHRKNWGHPQKYLVLAAGIQ